VNGNNGTIVLDDSGGGGATANYTFTGLAPILVNAGTPSTAIFFLPTAVSNQAFFEDNGNLNDGLVRLRSGNGNFQTTTFANPPSDTQIHLGDQGDTLTERQLDNGYHAFVDVTGGAGNDDMRLDFSSGVNIIPTGADPLNQVSFTGNGGNNSVHLLTG